MAINKSCAILASILTCPFLSAEQSAAQVIRGVERFEIVSRLTGAASSNQTNLAGIGGTDLGHMVNHNGRTYYLFGDTFSGETPAEGGSWRHNVMAYSSDQNPSDGIVFDDWVKDQNNQAREVIRSGRGNPITEIPTGAVSLNGKIYAYYMAVNQWGPGSGVWTIDYAGLAYWREGDSQFTTVDPFEFAGDGNFGMVAAALRSPLEGIQDDHLYIWGTPSGRLGGVKLARVQPDEIEHRSSYAFFDGLVDKVPQWTSDERLADLIVPPSVGEMSVMYNEAARAWTMLYFDESNDTFQIRQSPQPWGPWSNPIRVATSPQAPGGLYGPYMNPLFVEDGGKTIYFTMSLWSPYDVYLAKATLTISPPTIAFTHFNEPPLDSASHDPAPADQEIGFQTVSTPTTGQNPLAAIVASGSSPTTPIFSHRSVDATTTFDPVDVSGYDDVNVSLHVRVRDTTYESPDRLRIFVTNGADQIDLLNRAGTALNALATLDYQLYSADVPETWTQASLVVSSYSNSSTGAERFDFDSILFAGVLTPIIGDANGDGIVDRTDLAIVAANYGTMSGATIAEGDFDNNGRVNLEDLRLLKSHFGERLTALPLAAIPEPANWVLGIVFLSVALWNCDGVQRSQRRARLALAQSR